MNTTANLTISDIIDEVCDYINFNFDEDEVNEFVWNEIQVFQTNITKMEHHSNFDLEYLFNIAPKYLKFPLFEIVEEQLTDREYWMYLAESYISMNTRNENLIEKLFSSRSCRSEMMEEHELNVFNNLPDTFTVYRGCTASNFDGISWTISKEMAEKFAKRNSSLNQEEGIVREMIINKSQVAAYCEGEKEVLLLDI